MLLLLRSQFSPAEALHPEAFPAEAFHPEAFHPEVFPAEAFHPEAFPAEAFHPNGNLQDVKLARFGTRKMRKTWSQTTLT